MGRGWQTTFPVNPRRASEIDNLISVCREGSEYRNVSATIALTGSSSETRRRAGSDFCFWGAPTLPLSVPSFASGAPGVADLLICKAERYILYWLEWNLPTGSTTRRRTWDARRGLHAAPEVTDEKATSPVGR